jgi:hypothetical protein
VHPILHQGNLARVTDRLCGMLFEDAWLADVVSASGGRG